MRTVDTFELDATRDLSAIECDQVSGGGTPKPATPPPEPQLPPSSGFPSPNGWFGERIISKIARGNIPRAILFA